MDAASLLFSHLKSTRFDKKVAVRVTTTTESSYTIGKITQIAESFVVTPEQSKLIRPVDMTILNMIPECYLGLTTYLNKVLRAFEPEHKNRTFWFPTLEKPDNKED